MVGTELFFIPDVASASSRVLLRSTLAKVLSYGGTAPIASSGTTGSGSVSSARGVVGEPLVCAGREPLSAIAPPACVDAPFPACSVALPSPCFTPVCALRFCKCSLHPECPNVPLRISPNVGAFAATCPVAAHMPGGGVASNSLILAARMRLPPELLEALVAVRERLCALVDEVAAALTSCSDGGYGKDTGVGTLPFGEGMIARIRNCEHRESACDVVLFNDQILESAPCKWL
jgi:hypothetical protein